MRWLKAGFGGRILWSHGSLILQVPYLLVWKLEQFHCGTVALGSKADSESMLVGGLGADRESDVQFAWVARVSGGTGQVWRLGQTLSNRRPQKLGQVSIICLFEQYAFCKWMEEADEKHGEILLARGLDSPKKIHDRA